MAGKATKIVGGLSVVTGIVLAIWYFARGKPSILLKEGWNDVTYIGSPKSKRDALDAIWGYLLSAIYWNEETGLWEQPDDISPGQHWAIKVTRDMAIENFEWWEI